MLRRSWTQTCSHSKEVNQVPAELAEDTVTRLKIKGLENRVKVLEGVILRMQGEQLRQKIAKKKAIEKHKQQLTLI